MAPPRPIFDRWGLDILFVAAPAITGFCFPAIFVPVIAVLSSDEGSVYSALVGFHGAILGFVLAALSITAGYAQSERFAIVRASGQLSNLYGIYIAGATTELIALAIALLALVTRFPPPFHLALALAAAGTTTLAIVRLSRTVWITSVVVRATATSADRAPGQQ